MGRLLIVHHTPTAATERLLDAVVTGAGDDAIEGVDVATMAALAPDIDQVSAASGFVLVTPANFGYMSGALKHFFDSVFLAAGGSLSDDGSSAPAGRGGKLPYGLLVHGRYDTTGAIRSVESIVQALNWQQSAATVSIVGDVDDDHLGQASDLGATLAALLS